MKAQQKIKNAVILFLVFLATNTAIAQSSVNSVSTEEIPREKVFVQMKISPHTKIFMANVNPTDSVMKFRIWVANPEEAKVTISIKSENSGYYFSKRLSDAWYAQTYDFSNVEDGIYTIEIEKGKETFRKNILISTENYTVRKTNVY